MIQDLNEGADDVLDLFKRIHEGLSLIHIYNRETEKLR